VNPKNKSTTEARRELFFSGPGDDGPEKAPAEGWTFHDLDLLKKSSRNAAGGVEIDGWRGRIYQKVPGVLSLSNDSSSF
jgi:hypothetical protein